MNEMHLNIIKRLEAEANFCNKNPRNCSIRTFDVLEDAKERIEELQAKNKQLEKAIFDFGKNPTGFDWAVLDKIDELEIENGQLKQDLIEFGRHSPGCPHQYDKKYHCKCGWLGVEQTLKD